jgi:hypothetical protein
MTALHRIANLLHPRMDLAPLRSLHPKPDSLRALARRAPALGLSGLRAGPAPELQRGACPLCDRGLPPQGLPHVFRLTALGGVGPGHAPSGIARASHAKGKAGPH